MTPNEFIYSINLQIKDPHKSRKPLLDFFRGTIEDEEEKADLILKVEQIIAKYYSGDFLDSIKQQVIESLHKDLCHQLLEQFRDQIPEFFLELLDSERVGCGLVEDERPYCQCINYENDNYAILMSRGLTQILYSLIRAFSTNICFSNETTTSIEEVSSIMADDFFIFKHTFSIAPRQKVEISKKQIMFASTVCSYCELFYLFHELSHIIIDSINKNDKIDLDKQEEEHLADYLAMKSMLLMGDSGSKADILFLACDFSLLVFDILEKLNLIPNSEGYPSCKQRINYLRQELKKETDTSTYQYITNFADIAESVFDKVYLFVSSSSNYESKYLDTIKMNIESILNKYWRSTITISDSNYLVPDYSGSEIEFQQLLQNGHYQSIYNTLYSFASNLSDKIKMITQKRREDFENMSDEETMDYLIAFNKYKIILQFVNNLNEPIKTAFGDICFLHR